MSWKAVHKNVCLFVADLKGIPVTNERLTRNVDRWMYEWRGIVERYAFAALDLTNHPGRHKTDA